MSQPNEIELSVNEDMDDGTTATISHVYGRDNTNFPNKTEYYSDVHTPELRDMLAIQRVDRKTNGNFRGVKKSSFKFTKDYTVDGADGLAQIIAPQIIEVNFSIPMGVSAADTLAFRARVNAMIEQLDIMSDLCDRQII
jgi:hypothetical protein